MSAEHEEQAAGGPEDARPPLRTWRTDLIALRLPLPAWQAVGFALACVVLVFVLWLALTHGASEQRLLSPLVLPSPAETFGSLHELWFDRALTRNMLATLRRVVVGFALAAAVGVPLGVLCGCFSAVHWFFTPLTIFGRNIPLAALIALTFFAWGIGETQKVMFIFLASVMFIVADTTDATRAVEQRYVDTAYTLGAGRWQVILKVLVPLAMPSVFNALRLLFGLAFGYIMLAEVVKFGDEAGGIGDIINVSLKRGLREHIWLVLLIIPIVALIIDRCFFWVQRELFPHRYGGAGLLNRALRGALHGWEGLTRTLHLRRRAAAEGPLGEERER